MFVEKRHAEIIKSILKDYPYTFYAFGSRIKGKNRKFSDLDLCYVEEVPFRDLRKIHERFESSDLPFKVDIVDYKRCNRDFQEILKKEMVPLKDQI
jgi:uncharacterized protein